MLISYNVHNLLYSVYMGTVFNLLDQPLAMLDANNVVNLSGQVLATRVGDHLERDGTVLIRWDGNVIQTRDGVAFGQLNGVDVNNAAGQTLAHVSDKCDQPIILAAAFMFFFAGTN